MKYSPSHALAPKPAFPLAVLFLVSLLPLTATGMALAKPATGHAATGKATASHAVTAKATTPSLSILHNFDPAAEGPLPDKGLVQGPDGSLYGVTTQTGGGGVVFKVAPDGTNFTIVHKFSVFSGGYTPLAKLLLVGNLLFGTCSDGGGSDYRGGTAFGGGGIVFVIDLSQVSATDNSAGFTVLHYFGYTTTPASLSAPDDINDGAGPEGRLFLAADGSIYGTTYVGGTQGQGTIFQLQPDASGHFSVTPTVANGVTYDQFNGTYAKIYEFPGGNIAANPRGGVIQGADGFLYGTTADGGNPSGDISPNLGIVYKIATSGDPGTFALLHAFTGEPGDGSHPECDLIFATDGNLYGTTLGGGTVFQIKPDSSGNFVANGPFQTLHNYQNSETIEGGVIQASDGNLYGVTLDGDIFALYASGGQFASDAGNPALFATVYSFPTQSSNDPQGPSGGVIQGQDGRLYGETIDGGQLANGTRASGTVFALNAGLPGAPVIASIVNAAGNPVTVTDTTLVIKGSNFVAGAIVSIGNPQGATLTHVSLDSSAQITVTLSQALLPGSHNVTITDPEPGGLTSNVYVITIATVNPAPTINAYPNGILYSLLGGTQGRLTINGASFVDTPTVTVNGPDSTTASPGTTVVHFNSSRQVTATFPQPLAAGIYGLVLQNPDGQKTTGFNGLFAILGVTGITYADPAGGSPTLTITGGGFLGDPEKTEVFLGADTTGLQIAPSAVTVTDSHTITVALAAALAPGVYPITLANADGQTATATLIVNSPIGAALEALLNVFNRGGAFGNPLSPSFNGTLPAFSIVRPVYHPVSVSAIGPQLSGAQAAGKKSAAKSDAKLIAHAAAVAPVIQVAQGARYENGPTYPGGPSFGVQFQVFGTGFLAGASSGKAPLVRIDGDAQMVTQYSDTRLVVEQTAEIDAGIWHTMTVTTPDGSATSASFNVAIPNQKLFGGASAYQVSGHSTVAGSGAYLGGKLVPGTNAAPALIFVGGKMISQDGSSLISQDGGGLVAAGNSEAAALSQTTENALISQDGGGLISQDGGGLISQDGGGLISQDGGGLKVAPADAPVASNDGGSFSNNGSSLVGNDGSSLVGNDGSSLTAGSNLFGGAAGFSAIAAHAAPRLASSPHDTATTGPTDVSFFVSQGQSVQTLVTIRYTPGQRDIILYQAPGITVTPVNGTPAPVTAAPVSVTVTRAPLTLDPKTHQPYQVLTLKNAGAAALAGPVDVALTGLPAAVTVVGAAGTLDGSPAVTATGGSLGAGASVKVRVNFSDPTNARFSYGTAVYTGAL